VLERLVDALASLPLVPTYLVLMALSALENVFPPVPADTAVALGAFLARRGEVSVVPLAFLCWLSNLGSASFT
jgi:membrane protein DedA with SNARE-associated domain